MDNILIHHITQNINNPPPLNYQFSGKDTACFFTFCWPCISIHPCNENQLDTLFITSVYFINQPLHVLGIFVAHHQDVYCIYTIVLFSWLFHHNSDNRQSTKKLNTYQLLHIYSIPLDDGLQICQKHVEVDGRSKLRINSAQRRFSLHGQTVCV